MRPAFLRDWRVGGEAWSGRGRGCVAARVAGSVLLKQLNCVWTNLFDLEATLNRVLQAGRGQFTHVRIDKTSLCIEEQGRR